MGSGAERILDFSNDGAYLSVRYGQLIVKREGMPDLSTPLAEIAALILANARVTCTQSVLSGLMAEGAAVLVCDDSMLPNGLMLPLSANTLQTERMIAQASVTEPRKKRIWQSIVRAKIMAQASLLQTRIGDDGGLLAIAASVRSGDAGNAEAHAAQRYWPRLFGDSNFRRRRDAPDQNRLLNYGYAVIRAAVGRAICANGLHPSLGVCHHGRSNPYCLADDLMEPWRVMIDDTVAEIVGQHGPGVELDAHTKQQIIGVLHERLTHEGESRTVMDWIGRSAASLGRAFCSDDDVSKLRVFFPDGLVRS
ncbi:MAG: type II CRISPR-associated endonuclease Cas1 [Phycisphaeraceae bacterium]|nr:type II CRISPR-associated endonuclease Cas1 [Phycisphaeraceae bacterium]MBX3368532.1 type II CRISPR-associated endonuclease Cas1 [Phycisphaeraceae bacterium]